MVSAVMLKSRKNGTLYFADDSTGQNNEKSGDL